MYKMRQICKIAGISQKCVADMGRYTELFQKPYAYQCILNTCYTAVLVIDWRIGFGHKLVY